MPTNETDSSDESSYNYDEDENYDELESLEYEFDSYEYVDELLNSNEEGKTCKCLPACSSIYYAAELSQSSIDVHKHRKINKNFNDDDEE